MKYFSLALAASVVSGTLLSAQQAPPSAVAGTWEVDGQPTWLIVLEVDGTVLSGTVIQGNLEHEIFDASLTNDRVTFKARTIDGDRIVSFDGRFAGERIQFTRDVTIVEGGVAGGNSLMGGNGPSEFTMRRAEGDRWTGMIRNAPTPRNLMPRPNPRAVTLTTRKIPDPHWRWRGGDKDITVRLFGLANFTFPLDSFDLNEERLAYTFTRNGVDVRCELTRKSEGEYAGQCRSPANFNVFIALTPPATPGGQAPNRH